MDWKKDGTGVTNSAPRKPRGTRDSEQSTGTDISKYSTVASRSGWKGNARAYRLADCLTLRT